MATWGAIRERVERGPGQPFGGPGYAFSFGPAAVIRNEIRSGETGKIIDGTHHQLLLQLFSYDPDNDGNPIDASKF